MITNSATAGLQLLWALAPTALLICATVMSGMLLLAADWAFKGVRAPARDR